MKILLTMEYNGSKFYGWQIQPNKRTVQNEVEKALEVLFNERISVFGSGRTDSGVHATGQTAHFEVNENKFSMSKLAVALNANLPSDIKILKAKKVQNDFHARFDVKEKIYLYRLEIAKTKPSPLLQELVGTCRRDLDITRMLEAAKYLLGEHDFTSFSGPTQVKDFVRTIHYIKIKKTKNNIITFEISGNGFLYNMVRIIVGTLIDVGSGKRSPEDIKEILLAKDRAKSGAKVDAAGLYLKKVIY